MQSGAPGSHVGRGVGGAEALAGPRRGRGQGRGRAEAGEGPGAGPGLGGAEAGAEPRRWAPGTWVCSDQDLQHLLHTEGRAWSWDKEGQR